MSGEFALSICVCTRIPTVSNRYKTSWAKQRLSGPLRRKAFAPWHHSLVAATLVFRPV